MDNKLKDLPSFLKVLFKQNRSLQFIKKNLHSIELKAQHHLRIIEKTNTDRQSIEIRCQKSKCSFKIQLSKKNKVFQLSNLNVKHGHPELNPLFELEHLKKLIEKQQSYIFQEYFLSRINHEQNCLQLLRPCLILEDLKNKHIFSLNSLHQNKKYKVQLKKKFDNIIQNLRREFKELYPKIQCIEDSFQIERQNKNSNQKTYFNNQNMCEDESLQSGFQDHREDQDFSYSENTTTLINKEEESEYSLSSEQTFRQYSCNQLSQTESNSVEQISSQEDLTHSNCQSSENIKFPNHKQIQMQQIKQNNLTQYIQNSNIQLNNQPIQQNDKPCNQKLENQQESSLKYNTFQYETIIINNSTIIQNNKHKQENKSSFISQNKLETKQKQSNLCPFGYFDWFYQNNRYY